MQTIGQNLEFENRTWRYMEQIRSPYYKVIGNPQPRKTEYACSSYDLKHPTHHRYFS